VFDNVTKVLFLSHLNLLSFTVVNCIFIVYSDRIHAPFTVSGASTAGQTRQIEAQAGPATEQAESTAITSIADGPVACQQCDVE